MTAETFRELVMELPGVVEQSHMGHPDFRANGRIFASLQADDERGMVKVQPIEQETLIAEHPSMFVPAAGAWGRQGCTMVKLKAAKPAVVRGALLLALDLVNSLPPARKRTKKRPLRR